MTKQIIIIVLLMALIVLGCELWTLQLRDVSFLTGWLLIILAGVIALLIVAHRYHHNVSSFMQKLYRTSHLVLGWVMLFVFLLHVEFKLPRGTLEWCMTGLFVLMCAAGIGELIYYYVNRRNSTWQTRDQLSPYQLRFYRKKLRDDAENVVILATESRGDAVLADYYTQYIQLYFNSVPKLFAVLLSQKTMLAKMMRSIQGEIKKAPEYRNSLNELRELIRKKSSIEYQYAWHSFFSSLLVIHRYLSYSLVGLIMLHIALVYVFTG